MHSRRPRSRRSAPTSPSTTPPAAHCSACTGRYGEHDGISEFGCCSRCHCPSALAGRLDKPSNRFTARIPRTIDHSVPEFRKPLTERAAEREGAAGDRKSDKQRGGAGDSGGFHDEFLQVVEKSAQSGFTGIIRIFKR